MKKLILLALLAIPLRADCLNWSTVRFLGQSLTYCSLYAPSGVTGYATTALNSAKVSKLRKSDDSGDAVTVDAAGNVTIGTTVHSSAAAEPACDASHRGWIVRVQGGAGVADTYRQCTKSAADTYTWAAFGGSGSPAYNLGSVNPIGDPGATETIDPANGAVQTMTLSTDLTIDFTQPVGYAAQVWLIITQNAAAAKTVTWTSVKWPSGLAPVITTTLSAVDIIKCLLDGTNTYCSSSPDFK